MVAVGKVGNWSRGASAVTVLLALVAALLVASPAEASHFTNTEELSGGTNVQAAVAWSRATYPSTAGEVLLGRDDLFADSLASGSMQTTRPLLLTASQTLSPETDAELKRLQPEFVNIMGGASAVSTAIENDLKSQGYQVRRFSGPTRIETAIDIARRNYLNATTAIVARAFAPSGGDATAAFADSIAAGGWAAAGGLPVLLTESDRLTLTTKNYLRGSSIRTVFVVGGTSAVSDAVVNELRSIDIAVERVAGATRFDTAVSIAQRRGFSSAAQASHTILTEGQAANAWAAGFAAAAYARANNAPIVLSTGSVLPAPSEAFLSPQGGAAGTALICGPGASESACDEAAEAMGHSEITGSAPTLVSVTAGVPGGGVTPLSFTFSEPVASQIVNDNFRVYSFDALQFEAISAARHATSQNVVVANFASTDLDGATVVGVASGGVRSLASNVSNPEGSAPLGSYTRSAGTSRAPNLSSFTRVQGSNGDSSWDVRFTFDKLVSNCGAQSSYILVRDQDGDTNGAIDTVAGSGGGNAILRSGSCEVTFGGVDTWTFDQVARGFVKAASATVEGASLSNPATSTSRASTAGPDITGITVNADNGSATFSFDTNLAAAVSTSGSEPNFKLYDSFGRTIGGTGASVSATNSQQVIVQFDSSGPLRNVILGGSVENGAVRSAGTVDIGGSSLGVSNGAMEFGISQVFTSGRTSAPELTDIQRTASNSTLGNIAFVFSDDVSLGSGGFFVYDAEGERTQLSDCAVDDETVNCDATTADSELLAAIRGAVYAGISHHAVRPAGQNANHPTLSPSNEAGAPIES